MTTQTFLKLLHGHCSFHPRHICADLAETSVWFVTLDAVKVSITCRAHFETVKQEIKSSDVNTAVGQ